MKDSFASLRLSIQFHAEFTINSGRYLSARTLLRHGEKLV
jgi:hypothetical protein